MPAPTLLPAVSLTAESLPRLNAWRVLEGAAVALFFVAWLFVIAHAGLLLAAEWRLAQILREANDFARLPRVNSRELTDVVRHQVQQAGLGTPRILVMPSEDAEALLHVAAIEVSADRAIPAWLRQVTPPVERPLRALK